MSKNVRLNPKYLETGHIKIDLRKQLHFDPDRLAFNLSFVTRDRRFNFEDKGFSKIVKAKLFDKMVRLSSDNFNVILGWSKSVGLENLPETAVRLAINPEFVQSHRHEDCLPDYWIFRLANTGRVIGKIQEKTFYVLAVDTKFKLYKH
ncbi:hypothetical protein [Levilactobacillus parabrevis]|uniref:hypothetical protein n=1 Tax=Levilactobacillus parabrevis TaxID=357278 RepID=UPI000367132A|nr:hypothetical protein [Levilactobacillus parabrevis]KRO06430.1 hypothetical protein IV61_GL000183 [Levilactobacillus parabrevis]